MDAYIVVNLTILFLAALMPVIGGVVFLNEHPRRRIAAWLKRRGFKKEDPTNNDIFLTLAAIPLIFITVFRSPDNGLSTDYGTYLENSDYIHKHGLSGIADNSIIQIEDGLASIMYFAGHLLEGTIVPFIFITTVITLLCYFYRFKRDSPIVWLSLFTLVTFGSYYVIFNGIAQATAVAIAFFATGLMYRKKRTFKGFIKYTIIILLAALIHKTALLMIPMYLLLPYRFNSTKAGIVVKVFFALFIVLAFLFLDNLFDFGVNNFFPEYLAAVDNEASWLGAGSIIAILRPLFILVFIYVNRKYVDYKNKMDIISINATIAFLLINILSLQTHLLQRFSYYFIPLSILIIPLIVSRMKKGVAQRWTFVLVGIFMVFSIASVYVGGDTIFKYIWDEVL